MTGAGPSLERLTRRISECPSDFLAEPREGKKGDVHVGAVVHDLLLALGGAPKGAWAKSGFSSSRAGSRNHMRAVLVASWLLYDACFRDAGCHGAKALAWLETGLAELAGIVAADALVTDPDRREELARLCLAALGLRPGGETGPQAEDRLRTLDSVERAGLLRDMKQKREQARQLREQARQKAARESAAKASREW